ncbi:MAG: hypothetical protein ACYCW6_09630 [Candidatus Xenobia bacterium]
MMGESVLSPDGTVRVDFVQCEMRPTQWLQCPVVVHVPSGEVLLDLSDTLWDAAASFDAEGRLTLRMRLYDSERGETVVIDPQRRTLSDGRSLSAWRASLG